ncbi:hypothetical protein ABN080_05395 [Proteus sp. fly-1089]|uniref:hypothetical protein n=1 Tax=Proteus sp. fly-1089 TaxID=3136675 RepID=UPI0032D9BF0B
MATSKKESKEKITDSDKITEQQEIKKKTCFVIMPIADHPDYEKGHFKRVYEYLIKPACETAGYEPIRADDSKASHMIMFDILKKIVECDMAICDLSTKNANVFYELGLRQAFNKKTILITDGKEKTPFDILGFRHVTYSPNLRIDQTKIDIEEIKDMLLETESASQNDINSIVKLLEIEPAKIDYESLNNKESIFFNMLTGINHRLDLITDHMYYKSDEVKFKNSIINNFKENLNLYEILTNKELNPYAYKYYSQNGALGEITSMHPTFIKFSMGEKYSRDPQTLKGIKVNDL